MNLVLTLAPKSSISHRLNQPHSVFLRRRESSGQASGQDKEETLKLSHQDVKYIHWKKLLVRCASCVFSQTEIIFEMPDNSLVSVPKKFLASLFDSDFEKMLWEKEKA